jgi:asparagine synthase (glutamine-hydrolysing)
MAARLHHRGPDDAGAWTDPATGVALAHRRLSVIDLSPAGHQPMLSASGRYVMVFNGEIYNHEDLRMELEKSAGALAWRGHSDTESLLAGVEQWGLEGTLTRSVGMFAIAIFDRATGVLSLARDRLGEKPLYYGWAGGSFLFASELKAFGAFPGFRHDVCRESRVFKLEPGCLLTLRAPIPAAAPAAPWRPPHEDSSVAIRRWWSMSEVVQSSAAQPFTQESGALDELESRLRHAVKLQSLADVPLGAFLSGGVDSSLIAALMQTQSARPVKTFTVGFEDKAFDESPFSRAVAEHLGTDHSELFVTARDAQQVIPMLPDIYDEPFADSSQIPTYLVCRAARQHVTVALSGDAGDELFGGYNRYFWGPRVWDKIGWMPFALRAGMGHAIRAVPVKQWARSLPGGPEGPQTGGPAERGADTGRPVPESRLRMAGTGVSAVRAQPGTRATGSIVGSAADIGDARREVADERHRHLSP